jgi:hypothetical protein
VRRIDQQFAFLTLTLLVLFSAPSSAANAPVAPTEPGQPTIVAPSPAALRMIETVDAMNVENHWPAGQHIDWETGLPDGRPLRTSGKHTHCSAFVAAAAERLGIYILRPPEHSQTLLANAQYEWLGAQGARRGWAALADALDAQNHANLGYLVVAVYRNHNANMPGHIAIVRPVEKSVAEFEPGGLQITQAGLENYRITTLRHGFSGHPGAVENQEVRFFAHAVGGS